MCITNARIAEMTVKLNDSEMKLQLARKNMSQNWLAQSLGVTSGYMSQLMCGVRNPSPKLRERIMELLPECSFDDLFILNDKQT